MRWLWFVLVLLYFACVRALWISRRKSGSRLTNYLILHTFALWIVNLIGLVTAALAFQWLFGSTTQRIMDTESWSQRLCLPDSSEVLRVYAEDQILLETAGLLARFRKLALISNLAFAISGILTDAMLIWRCRQIWKFTLCSRPSLVVLFPTLLLVGSMVPLGLSCAIGFTSNALTLTYFTVTLILNLLLTSLIILRLWQRKSQLQKTLGAGHGDHYNIISTVFAESAFMNAVCSILLLASSLYRTASISPIMGSMLDVWVAITPAVQACSNYLIIYRGTKGWYGSWSNDVTMTPSTAVFERFTSSSFEHDEHDSYSREG
ncbi:hypothetical protein QCA50_016193 [Cerrena zonata]|uniref:Uncharacterized protein n=1 Tax=Cerrena zonata TaxID=2478898 RepID=A0AAW0FTL5_9APHY